MTYVYVLKYCLSVLFPRHRFYEDGGRRSVTQMYQALPRVRETPKKGRCTSLLIAGIKYLTQSKLGREGFTVAPGAG